MLKNNTKTYEMIYVCTICFCFSSNLFCVKCQIGLRVLVAILCPVLIAVKSASLVQKYKKQNLREKIKKQTKQIFFDVKYHSKHFILYHL